MKIPSSTSRVSGSGRLATALTCAGVLAVALVLPAAPGLSASGRADQAAMSPARQGGDVARGEYLVNAVAMCVQCHSPRDAAGNIIESRKLTGASMPVRGPSWSAQWAYQAPPIARLSGFTDEQIVALLTEGRATDRPRPMPPMPQFRMSREDATAVIAYLRSR